MKKVVTIIFLMNLLFGAGINKYLNYSNYIFNYHFKLKNFNKIKEPFESMQLQTINGKVNPNSKLNKIIKVKLLSIFNKKAYVYIQEYLGDKLINSYKKWINKGDKIGECKVSLITFEKVILKCKNKTLVKTLYTKIPKIKEQQ